MTGQPFNAKFAPLVVPTIEVLNRPSNDRRSGGWFAAPKQRIVFFLAEMLNYFGFYRCFMSLATNNIASYQINFSFIAINFLEIIFFFIRRHFPLVKGHLH